MAAAADRCYYQISLLPVCWHFVRLDNLGPSTWRWPVDLGVGAKVKAVRNAPFALDHIPQRPPAAGDH